MRIRHPNSKLYSTLVLGRGAASGGIDPASDKRVSRLGLPVAAVTPSLSATTEVAPARSPIQAPAKPNWERPAAPQGAVVADEPGWRTDMG
jgi:hypothetical protein